MKSKVIFGLLAVGLLGLLLQQCKSDKPDNELLIGKWSGIVDGDTIVWFVEPNGSRKSFWYHENFVQHSEGSWELKGDHLYEKILNVFDTTKAVSQINFLTNDHMILTVIENGSEREHQQERHYFRQDINTKVSWLNGTWQGKFKDSYRTNAPNINFKDSPEYSVELKYDEKTGICQINYPTLRCRGNWLFTKQEGDIVFFSEKIENEKGANCLDFMNYKVTRKSDNKIEIYASGLYPLDEKYIYEAMQNALLFKSN
jgi:hypothetical protein